MTYIEYKELFTVKLKAFLYPSRDSNNQKFTCSPDLDLLYDELISLQQDYPEYSEQYEEEA